MVRDFSALGWIKLEGGGRKQRMRLTVNAYRAQGFPDDGMPLAEASERFGVKGAGRSGRERHFFIVTPITGGKARRAYLTPKGKTERDALGWALERIETDWCSEMGEATFDTLQASLGQALARFAPEAPVEPALHPTRWFRQLRQLAIGGGGGSLAGRTHAGL